MFPSLPGSKKFIMAQKQLIPPDWNPLDLLKSVKKDKHTGQFTSLQKIKNPVPENIVTASFLRYAYGVKKETFRRWMGQGSKFPERIPVNQGKNIIDDYTFAQDYFIPKRLFMQSSTCSPTTEKMPLRQKSKHIGPSLRNISRSYLKTF
jgi:hypothetical protein